MVVAKTVVDLTNTFQEVLLHGSTSPGIVEEGSYPSAVCGVLRLISCLFVYSLTAWQLDPDGLNLLLYHLVSHSYSYSSS